MDSSRNDTVDCRSARGVGKRRPGLKGVYARLRGLWARVNGLEACYDDIRVSPAKLEPTGRSFLKAVIAGQGTTGT